MMFCTRGTRSGSVLDGLGTFGALGMIKREECGWVAVGMMYLRDICNEVHVDISTRDGWRCRRG